MRIIVLGIAFVVSIFLTDVQAFPVPECVSVVIIGSVTFVSRTSLDPHIARNWGDEKSVAVLVWRSKDEAVTKSLRTTVPKNKFYHSNNAVVVINYTPQTEISFGCKNSLISDEWRKEVLKFHNDQRRKVALGQQTTLNGTAMERAKNMNELVWDCDLEHNAYLKICDSTNIKIFSNYSITNITTIGKSGECDIIEQTKAALKEWWAESAVKDLSGDKNKFSGAIKDFGRMVDAQAKGFACTYSNCNTKNAKNELLCIYDHKLVNKNPLYTNAASESEICADCPVDKCTQYLCQYDYTGATNANPKPLCAGDGMTYDMQTIAKDMHNYYRRLLATGWAADSNGYAPRAKQMPALAYECKTIGKKTLALLDCNKADSLGTITATPGYSLNYHRESYKVSREETLKKAIDAWWGQLAQVDVDDKATYSAEVKGKANFFAPMAYESVTQFGCAVKDCTPQGYMIAACQYNGTLNVDDAMYTVGTPCAGCKQISKSCDPLGGICVSTTP